MAPTIRFSLFNWKMQAQCGEGFHRVDEGGSEDGASHLSQPVEQGALRGDLLGHQQAHRDGGVQVSCDMDSSSLTLNPKPLRVRRLRWVYI